MKDGLLGLLLYLVHWLSPGVGDAEIDINFVKKQENHESVFQCRLDAGMNRQLEQLIDAGIPLRFKFVNMIDQADTLSFVRTLQFNMVQFTYYWTDSVSGSVTRSQDYSLIHLAMVDFCGWQVVTPENAQFCRLEVLILPSRAEQLNRVVDMSRVWGQQKVTASFNPSEQHNPKQAGERKGRF